MIEQRYPVDVYNIYAFHISDGDNWEQDNERCL
ncbi:uncharacterized sporulation protein YeaH/YhbH (DUF444 family) [Caldalkalibacillus uzonensis]|uniref:Uncharacterized sporulation protein YeaH/YhbH (DUF444 family) n=1 Tax=Caldalkalibacillus uzonensis TaxID=353224 RepID=A0ABU0CUH5_9BACI|nr:uncharacterized sporulation protein YeaH/YhbH (DUF444 family) [Caldalkalibacillus uzonensis]